MVQKRQIENREELHDSVLYSNTHLVKKKKCFNTLKWQTKY